MTRIINDKIFYKELDNLEKYLASRDLTNAEILLLFAAYDKNMIYELLQENESYKYFKKQ